MVAASGVCSSWDATEPDEAAVAIDLAPKGIQPHPRVLDHRRSRGGTAPAERAQPGHQLGKLERLGEVVVGAELEPRHLVVEATGRGEHQHAAAGVERVDPAAHLVAVHDRDVAVEHDGVVVVDGEALERRTPVVHGIRGDRLTAQAVADRLREIDLVFDHEHAHVNLGGHDDLFARFGRVQAV